MYPVIFEIGSVSVPSFWAMVLVATFASGWLFRRQLAASRLPDCSFQVVCFGLAGGIAGGKLGWALERLDTNSFQSMMTSRGGLSWFGALIAGTLVVVTYLRWRSLPVLVMMASATPSVAAGQAILRIGCFLTGDDYGIPTDLPWGMAFPKGTPPTFVHVHPTQLYEAACLLVLAVLLIRLQRRLASGVLVSVYLVLAGSVRLLIQSLRDVPPVFWTLSSAHLVALVMVAVGSVCLAFHYGRRKSSAPDQRSSLRCAHS
jgi:phosphatidylglycerol:prolipoprotein diacylglycerol transferase